MMNWTIRLQKLHSPSNKIIFSKSPPPFYLNGKILFYELLYELNNVIAYFHIISLEKFLQIFPFIFYSYRKVSVEEIASVAFMLDYITCFLNLPFSLSAPSCEISRYSRKTPEFLFHVPKRNVTTFSIKLKF